MLLPNALPHGMVECVARVTSRINKMSLFTTINRPIM